MVERRDAKPDWPQEIKRVQLANFRPGIAERSARHVPAHRNRPGMDPGHLGLLRKLPCSVCPVISRIDPHHLKSGPAAKERAFGRKSTDRWAVPVCRFHHEDLEAKGSCGELAWFQRYALDPLELANALWTATGDLNRMIRVLDAHKQAAFRALKVNARANALVAHSDRKITKAEAIEQVEAGLGRGK